MRGHSTISSSVGGKGSKQNNIFFGMRESRKLKMTQDLNERVVEKN